MNSDMWGELDGHHTLLKLNLAQRRQQACYPLLWNLGLNWLEELDDSLNESLYIHQHTTTAENERWPWEL